MSTEENKDKPCEICGHSMFNNLHGFDQNDGFINEKGELVLYGTCTYCKICNPRLFAKYGE